MCREERRLTGIRAAAATKYLTMAPVSVLSVVLAVASSVLLAHCIRWYVAHTRPHGCIESRVENQVTEYRKIADFSFFDAKTPEDRLKLRAKPNARLITTFSIHNSFTTSDTDLHKRFVKTANHAIDKVHTEDWIKLGKVTQTILELCQKHFSHGLPYMPLASCE